MTTTEQAAFIGLGWFAVMLIAAPAGYQMLVSLGFVAQTCISNICF